jgi:hypothetical protein
MDNLVVFLLQNVHAQKVLVRRAHVRIDWGNPEK